MPDGDLNRTVAAALDDLSIRMEALKPMVDEYVTPDRVRRYVIELADMPAPSTAASAFRGPVLRSLLTRDGVLDGRSLCLDTDFRDTGSAVLTVGASDASASLWYFAHLDTISYLVQPKAAGCYPLVPFCYHLTDEGSRRARAYRFDLHRAEYVIVAEGALLSVAGDPSFIPDDPVAVLTPGDRVVPLAPVRFASDGTAIGHFDNAGGVAALAVAAPVLAAAGIEALIAFPDEEEGPPGSGSQTMGRGSSRLIAHLPAPDFAMVVDMQQAGGRETTDNGKSANANRIGAGAVLAEFSSLGRGAVTPPHLNAAALEWCRRLHPLGVRIQESSNGYTSRSDDVSVMLRTPNILLLGFPGFDRHFDRAEPTAHLDDLVDLAKALIYASALRPLAALLRKGVGR